MMGEYVKRSDALQAVGDIHPLDYNGQGIVERIKAIPAADVSPVRHGRWINICGDGESPRQCSECLQDFDYIDGICYLVSGQRLPRYCPSCGAKMDGGQDETPTGPYDLLYEEGGPST